MGRRHKGRGSRRSSRSRSRRSARTPERRRKPGSSGKRKSSRSGSSNRRRSSSRHSGSSIHMKLRREARTRGGLSSESRVEPLDKLTEAISTLVEKSSQDTNAMILKGETVPVFDPEDINQSSEQWCAKVDELQTIYRWNDQQTVHFALSKLHGLAETWYKGLKSVNFTWQQWKQKIQESFPAGQEYEDLLIEMLQRKKKPDEAYARYYHEKLALLNACEITGTKAVSCIIGGLDDNAVKIGAKAGKYKTPESLFSFLSAFNATSHVINHQKYLRPNKFKRQNQRHVHNTNTRDRKPNAKVCCFKCGQEGHFANQCSVKPRDDRCTRCQSRFHSGSKCPRKNEEKKKTVALLEIPASDNKNRKYYKDIQVNEAMSNAYVDFGSSCTIIRFSEANRLALVIDFKDRTTLYGYGNGVTSSIGSTSFKLKVDKVEAVIKAIVVQDKEQNIPVIIGRTFTELPNVFVIKDVDKLVFIDKTNGFTPAN